MMHLSPRTLGVLALSMATLGLAGIASAHDWDHRRDVRRERWDIRRDEHAIHELRRDECRAERHGDFRRAERYRERILAERRDIARDRQEIRRERHGW